MARATKEQSEITARRIREVATGMFAERGYASVGLEEVAAAAQVTRGAVYHHYGNKQTLFEAVAAAAQQRVADAVTAAADAAADPWDGLIAGCRAFLTVSVTDSHRRILLLDAPAVMGWSTWRSQDAAASGHHLTEAIADLAATGHLTITSPEATSALLSGAMNEAALRIAEAPDRDAALEETWSDLTRLLNGLRSAAGPASSGYA
ncbi:TetR/AcrR family transcriptional regulator [Actinoplanes aureus]|uniref:TetR family transcriptional regulator n=1 Tax=Actinoplanes aureus TaxID=2792083 RepID=A0A931G0S1_9ACTN|nr:TetR/AcrR family transcriptional regulator [Actinoplanes aureus]MBG0564346.1 TetR family transcriptional regulator [Actinoplanes aureus]